MINKIKYAVLATVLWSCNGENAGDCFQLSGDVVQQQTAIEPFDTILVNEGIEMILREGPDHEVIVETGTNLLNEIYVTVDAGKLTLSNANGCNFFRDYAPATVYVTAPDITEIRSATSFDIRSEGMLTYPELHIISEDYAGDYLNTGDFYLTINNTAFSITFNNLSNCFVSGETGSLNIGFFGGNSRFEGAALLATQVNIFHRSSNDIRVHPLDAITGDIYSTGNVIALHEPPVVNVTAHYKGKLVFQD